MTVIGALVLLGLWQLVASKLRGVVRPVVLMTAGVVIQLAVLGLLTVDVMSRWWPVVLVLIGLYLRFPFFLQILVVFQVVLPVHVLQHGVQRGVGVLQQALQVAILAR